MAGKRTLTWRNHTGNQTCHPTAIESPKTLEQLVELVKAAEAERSTIRAVGAHHAWSDVALTDGVLLEPDHLGGGIVPDDATLREPPPRELVRVLAGTHLRDLNRVLDAAGLALPNMGGYDAQTIAGVVSTSTHGSGLRFGPFPDIVRSLEIVIAGGRVVRVEPAAGPTDPEKFAAAYGASRELIAEDDAFYAAVCGMGCMGIVHSLLVEVRAKFNVEEVRTLSTWEAVKPTLAADLAAFEHYELFVDPYERKGAHELLVTRRTETQEDPTGMPLKRQLRHPLLELQEGFFGTWVVTGLLARFVPKLMATGFGWVLRRMCDDSFVDVSYRVFNIGEANKIPAYSAELAVSLEGDRHIQAVERIFAIAAECRKTGLVHTSPIALRFVAPSTAYASMMFEQPTMMIELILAKGTRNGFDLLATYERELASLGIRPHWGQVNSLSAATDFTQLYEKWPQWRAVHDRFNASGVFNSPFTDRIGISRPRA
jgi:L-gulono-1,4-lactone dehydrogenase